MGTWAGRAATEIAASVRAGDVTARDVVQEHLDQIAARDGELNAFVKVRQGAALDEAAEVDARQDMTDLPLAGVPIAIKDNVQVAGEPMRSGSAATPPGPQEKDHPVVARLRAAGAVVVGLTNLPELGIYPFSDSAYGITRNPWDLSRTAGGSSGGSASAVASGMVAIGHGNDGAGSIRIPAANCGLFGLKPGTGVVPAELGIDDWAGMSENGPLATTVADAALMLSVLAADPALASVTEPAPLRIALSVKPPAAGVLVHRDFVGAVRATGRVLHDLGHTVEAEDPRYPVWAANAVIVRWLACPGAEAVPYRAADLEARTRRHAAAGRLLSRVRPPRDDDRARLRDVLAPFFEAHDVLVMPTLAQYAPRARRYGEGSWLRSVVTSLRYAPMTGAWNLAGYPAASVPAGLGPNGLPMAVQLVAAPGGEAMLLGLAAQLERVRPWARLAPPRPR